MSDSPKIAVTHTVAVLNVKSVIRATVADLLDRGADPNRVLNALDDTSDELVSELRQREAQPKLPQG